MKRLSILFLLIATVFTVASADETKLYQGELTAKDQMGGSFINATADDVSVYLTKCDDGTYKIELMNFIFTMSDNTFYIGNITVPKMTATENADGTISLQSKAGSENNILLSSGTDPSDVNWIGASLGGAKGDVDATISGNTLSLYIPVTVKVGFFSVTIDVTFQGVTEEEDIPADVNGDGTVDIADVNAILTVIFDDTQDLPKADVNGDNVVDIADVNAVLTKMFAD